MKYVRLGGTSLEISRVILGCMSFGDPDRGSHGWSLDEESARPYFRQAIEAGITTFDTANVYSLGSSERITGRLIREFSTREQSVIMTKVGLAVGSGPTESGLSPAAITAQIDASLERLGTDYVDVYQVHRFDPLVPVEETMAALHGLIIAGKVRYIGASSMWLHQFVSLQRAAELNSWTPFVSMQDQYNLIMREEEREMHPFCMRSGVAVLPWSPLARGHLARPFGEVSSRSELDHFGQALYKQDIASDQSIVVAVEEIARARGVTMAQIALSWQFAKRAVTAPIVGATRPEHIADAVGALDINLTDLEVGRLEAGYSPRRPEGFD